MVAAAVFIYLVWVFLSHYFSGFQDEGTHPPPHGVSRGLCCHSFDGGQMTALVFMCLCVKCARMHILCVFKSAACVSGCTSFPCSCEPFSGTDVSSSGNWTESGCSQSRRKGRRGLFRMVSQSGGVAVLMWGLLEVKLAALQWWQNSEEGTGSQCEGGKLDQWHGRCAENKVLRPCVLMWWKLHLQETCLMRLWDQ